MVAFIHTSDATHLVDGGFVIQMADQGIARVGGHGHHPASSQQFDRDLDQARLGIFGVNLKKLGHGYWAKSGVRMR